MDETKAMLNVLPEHIVTYLNCPPCNAFVARERLGNGTYRLAIWPKLGGVLFVDTQFVEGDCAPFCD